MVTYLKKKKKVFQALRRWLYLIMCSNMLTESPKASPFQISLDRLLQTLGVPHLRCLCVPETLGHALVHANNVINCEYLFCTSGGGDTPYQCDFSWGQVGKEELRTVCLDDGLLPTHKNPGHQGVGEFPWLATPGACCHTLPRELSSVRTTGQRAKGPECLPSAQRTFLLCRL